MLTVLQVTPELSAGGVERTTIDMARALTGAGGRALVASAGGRLEDELRAAGGELIRLPAASKNPLVMARNAARLIHCVRDCDVDIVHARSRAPAWSALWAARATGARLVTTYAGIHTARGPLKRFYNSVMARGDRVIANSHFTAAHVRAEHGVPEARLRVIPRGVDVDALDPLIVSPERAGAVRAAWGFDGAAPGAPIVLLPGRLTRWKGQDVAIRACARLAAAHGPDMHLVIVGDDQGRRGYRDELAALIAAEGVADRVTLAGHCSDMPAAYAVSDVVISASVEPEAFGRVAVEAQCMGRPVIATDHGGARETIEEGRTGRLAKPGDADALARALGEVLSLSPGARLAMGDQGAERARRLFSVAAMQSATLRVYQEVVDAPDRGESASDAHHISPSPGAPQGGREGSQA